MSAYRFTQYATSASEALERAQEAGYVYSYRGARLQAALGPWLGLTGEQEYADAMFRASYYRWSARRNDADRDPIDGRVKKGWAVHVKAAQTADKALAAYWLKEAAAIRERSAIPADRALPGWRPVRVRVEVRG